MGDIRKESYYYIWLFDEENALNVSRTWTKCSVQNTLFNMFEYTHVMNLKMFQIPYKSKQYVYLNIYIYTECNNDLLLILKSRMKLKIWWKFECKERNYDFKIFKFLCIIISKGNKWKWSYCIEFKKAMIINCIFITALLN